MAYFAVHAWARWTVLAVAAIALLVFWSGRLSGAPIAKDGRQTLTMALNLQRHGVISLDADGEPPFEPSMYREPLPVLTTALNLALIDSLIGHAHPSEYAYGERARYVKMQNLAWATLLCCATFWSVHLFTQSLLWSLAGAVLVTLKAPLVDSGLTALGVDTLTSEIPAAAMLALGSALLVNTFRDGRQSTAVLAGACFGLLALIKAGFIYVFAGVAGVAFLLLLFERRRRPVHGGGVRLAHIVLFCAAFSVTVLPWLIRNYLAIGSFALAERGGVVLYIRAVKDGMSWEEYRGSFYVWAPEGIRQAVGNALGFSDSDLQRGGRLQRLNRRQSDFRQDDIAAEKAGRPERAISYYRKARAERVRLSALLNENGSKRNSGAEVDRILQEHAEDIILAQPHKHLAMTVPFMWRGAAIIFPVLSVTLAYALTRRRREVLLFALPAFGIVMFYSLLSHFLPRYASPTAPIAVICGLILTRAAVDAVAHRLSIRRVAASNRSQVSDRFESGLGGM
jgi:hypothetical protein